MRKSKLATIKKKLHHRLDRVRYEHTLGVMYTASALAMCYHADIDKALLAGVLHDCAKCIPNDKKLRLCKKYGLSVNAAQKRNPGLLHARLGAEIAIKKYQVDDPEILDAIRYHTTGRPNMALLEKIVYIADYIEPNRTEAPNLEKLRHLAFVDIDACLFAILNDSLEYLRARKEAIDPMTEEAYQYYQREEQ